MSAPTRRRRPTPAEAQAAFFARVAELGGRVVGLYVNTRTPVECVCDVGHLCRTRPNNVLQGQGICRSCSGNDFATADLKFRKRVAELGGRVVGEYVGKNAPVACICKDGHPCRPSPSSVQQGNGICRTCIGRDPATAEAAFHARIAEIGGHVVGMYVNAQTPVDCTCIAGHSCRAWPTNVQRGIGICRVCAGNDAAASEAAFHYRVTGLGGQVVGQYVDTKTPVDCICPAGHPCRPRPGNMGQGEGMCRYCRGKKWDVFYVVTNPTLARVKFGITSHDERTRLRVHRTAGYVNVVRVISKLADAADLERNILNTLRDGGVPPAQGREYYDLNALPVVLDVVDGWIAI